MIGLGSDIMKASFVNSVFFFVGVVIGQLVIIGSRHYWTGSMWKTARVIVKGEELMR